MSGVVKVIIGCTIVGIFFLFWGLHIFKAEPSKGLLYSILGIVCIIGINLIGESINMNITKLLKKILYTNKKSDSPLTVAELIKLLGTYDKNAKIFVYNSSLNYDIPLCADDIYEDEESHDVLLFSEDDF